MRDCADVAEPLEDRLQRRADSMRAWLAEKAPDCFTEQMHVRGPVDGKENTGRIYWHYGYMVALRDVLSQLQATGED